MRAWNVLAALVGVAAGALLLVAPMQAAGAAPRVGPNLSLSFSGDDSSVLTVSGRRCLPVGGAPTSVLVTADWQADKAFTATPDATGHWSVDVPLPGQLDGSYSVSAECDNYYGAMTYPPAGFGVAAASGSAPVPGATTAGTNGSALANTGSHAGTAAVVGVILLAVGAALMWFGRRRGVRGA
jgi:LPXTG-motif cell wall-anchored protein